MRHHCSYWRCAHHIGLFLAALFVLCFVWYYLNPAEHELHLQNLRLAFFGFSGMNFGSFLLGLVQSYIWAYIGTAVWWLVGWQHTCCSEKKE